MAKLFALDTHQVIVQLQAKGFSKDQAEGLADVLRDVQVNDQLATKSDLKDLEIHLTNQLTTRILTIVAVQGAFLAVVIAYLQLAG